MKLDNDTKSLVIMNVLGAKFLKGARRMPRKTNYKNEPFPANLESLVKKIDLKCSAVFRLEKSFSVSDMYTQVDGSNKILLNKQFKAHNQRLFLNGRSDVKGLYLFCDPEGSPFYVGISQTILRRIKQHFFGSENNQASLVYLMALEEYKRQKGRPFKGLRKKFPFDKYGIPKQKALRETTKITIVPIEDNFELYISEAYYSCYYTTKWNTFETH